MAQPAAQPESKKRSFLPYALAALEDTLSRQMGYAPQGVARINAQQAEQQKARDAQAAAELQRAQELADFEYKEQVKARYDTPAIQANAEYIERTEGPEAARAYRQNYGRPPSLPTAVSIPGLGTFYGTPEENDRNIRARMQAGGGAVPQKPVGGLTPMGGASSNASGNFRN